MNSQLIISFLGLLVCSSIYGSNNWADFDAHDIYPFYNLTNCHFPFTYQGQTYTNCTTDGNNGNRPWCSLTADYIGLFTYCYDFTKSTLQCVFPFTLNGRTFNECDYLSRISKYKQCKSNNPSYPFRYCFEEHITPKNQPLLHQSTCDPPYLNISHYHTKCAGPNDYAVQIPLSSDDKQAILDTHNSYRAAVGSRYMFKLYWDDDLAELAQVHSDMCAFDHDLAQNRLTLKWSWLNGQNMVMADGYNAALTDLLVAMFDSEQPRFVYGQGCSPPGTCTHYTQLMISNLTRVGCAETQCVYPDVIERFVTCNYLQAQYTNNYMIPYVPSNTNGVDCPATLDSTGLCDCGNKVCDYTNGEYLEPNTCTCKMGASKRSIEENNFEERDLDSELENNREPSIFLPGGNNFGGKQPEKREARKIHLKKRPAKRSIRRLPVNAKQRQDLKKDIDAMVDALRAHKAK